RDAGDPQQLEEPLKRVLARAVECLQHLGQERFHGRGRILRGDFILFVKAHTCQSRASSRSADAYPIRNGLLGPIPCRSPGWYPSGCRLRHLETQEQAGGRAEQRECPSARVEPRQRQSRSICSDPAAPTARPKCASCSAARARTSRKWRASASRFL